MIKCSPNMLKPGMTHVAIGPDSSVLKGFTTEQAAKDDVEARNAKAVELGLKARYTVAGADEVEK